MRGEVDLGVLRAIERRVLWLACRMVDHANHDRVDPLGMKAGGHQASSTSIATVMTALWFAHLDPGDRVAVKPHASPVLHAIEYLLGNLDESTLLGLREHGGLQAYPSRTKDPDRPDYSTGSVGLGAAAPLFGAAVRRYVHSHFGAPAGVDRPGRFVSIVGDAELDEGNVWEALADPATQGLGNVLWVVDLNRQSLDRVVPGIKAAKLERMFEDNGWHVVEAKYGRLLQAAFGRPGGEALRAHIDEMPNEEYQSLFRLDGRELADRFCERADGRVRALMDEVPDAQVAPLVQNLGGHDLGELLTALAAADAEDGRPSVIFAYTIKGYGLPIAGDPLNHALLLDRRQIEELRAEVGLTAETEWSRFGPTEPAGEWCRATAAHLRRPEPRPRPAVEIPTAVELGAVGTVSTQEVFGRLLTRLADAGELGRRLVTTSPDVAVSTNLGGWINKVGVYAPTEKPHFGGGTSLLAWHESPEGRHIELGISEMNLFLLLGQLGLAHELSGEVILPIGTVYDPFVLRGLDALVYALYSGARFVVVGTPSGTALSYEGGAHQSTITPSVGLELPGLVLAEPAYAHEVEWLLLDGLARLTEAVEPESLYLRLSTRPVDGEPFAAAEDRLGAEELRRQVLAGGYVLVDRRARPGERACQLVASGAVMPEVIDAADLLAEEGVAAGVVNVTSASRLYDGWRRWRQHEVRAARRRPGTFHLANLLGDRTAPIVTVHDASTHALAWLGSVFGAAVVPVGVDRFGESGSLPDVFAGSGIEAESIATSALLALEV